MLLHLSKRLGFSLNIFTASRATDLVELLIKEPKLALLEAFFNFAFNYFFLPPLISFFVDILAIFSLIPLFSKKLRLKVGFDLDL